VAHAAVIRLQPWAAMILPHFRLLGSVSRG
jgi:hypothetical protein